MSLFNSIIPNWWAENVNGSRPVGTPTLGGAVWVANRCQQMNAQQIASMPLSSTGPDEPAWVSSPDPNWFPNGIGDALHAIVDQMYGWGFVVLYVTDFYADGFPRTWTVLPSAQVSIEMRTGRASTSSARSELDPRRVVQIDRNPGIGLHGCSALRAYAQVAWGAGGREPVDDGEPGRDPAGGAEVGAEADEGAGGGDCRCSGWTRRSAGTVRRRCCRPRSRLRGAVVQPEGPGAARDAGVRREGDRDAYGVPSVLLNMALQGGLTYQNPAALGEMWWRFELRTTATRIANAFSAQMLPRGQWVSSTRRTRSPI
jgi:hypothetical protein